MRDLKRLGRYLKHRPRLVAVFQAQRMPETIQSYGDSDHAGCLKTRRSTTGVGVMLGSHLLKTYSQVQSTISLSSGESEYYAMLKASATGLALRAMLEDWGIQLKLQVLSDSSAARGLVARRGLGKARHIQTRYLWLQERVAEKDLQVISVPTSANMRISSPRA